MDISSDDLFYASANLNRQSHLRPDSQSLLDTLRSASARFLLLHDDRNLFLHMGEHFHPLALPYADIAPLLRPTTPWAYLGHDEGEDFFVLDFSDQDEDDIHLHLGRRFVFEDLRRAGPIQARTIAARCAYARGLMFWHKRHHFCGACGHPSQSTQGGHVRQCTNMDCGLEHFPRTDPAVIMLVHDTEKCLLANNHRIKTGMYSTLAGFVEPGETLEQAVRREVMEETGIKVGAVHYAGSQPWPFPTSLMIGFYAQAESYDITIDPHELSDAQWFSREDLRRFDEQNKRLPSRDSIARNLIEAWMKS